MLKDVLKKRRISSPGKMHERDIIDQFVNDINTHNFLSEDVASQIIFFTLLAATEAPSTTIALLLKLLSDHPLVLDELTVRMTK